MARPRNWWNIENIEDAEAKAAAITIQLKDLYSILNKDVTFDDNIRGALIDVSFTAANTDTQIRHTLPYAPQNYLVFSRSANLNVYDGSTATNNSFIYLKSSAIGSARVFIF